MKVIGIVGHARAGKDTVANTIIKHTPYIFCSVHIVRFADLLKDTVATIMNMTREELDKIKEEDSEQAMYVRKYLQNIGESARKVDSNIFVNATVSKIKQLEKTARPDIVVVPDVRYINEAQALKDNFDTVLIKVERPNLDLSDSIYNHESEKEISSIEADYVLINDKSLPEFKKDVVNLIFKKIFDYKELAYE